MQIIKITKKSKSERRQEAISDALMLAGLFLAACAFLGGLWFTLVVVFVL